MLTEGRTADERTSTGFRAEAELAAGRACDELRYGLGQGEAAFRDLATAPRSARPACPARQTDWLFYAAPPLAAGPAPGRQRVLDLTLTLDRDHGHLTPVLVDMAPDGTATTISRGFLNLLYRNGLSRSQAVPAGRADPRPRAPSSRRTRSSAQGTASASSCRARTPSGRSRTTRGPATTLDLGRSSLTLPLMP